MAATGEGSRHACPDPVRLIFASAWPRRQAASAGSAPVRSAKKRSHAYGLDRGAWPAKPGFDMPDQNCRIITRPVADPERRSKAAPLNLNKNV